MTEYPPSVHCNKPQSSYPKPVPCPGTAYKMKNPVMKMANGEEFKPERGPWYGCTKCRCLAQYKDFIEHLEFFRK